jgi:hypothetical protein
LLDARIAPVEYRTLKIAVGDWQLIDAGIDNSVAIAVVDGDVVTAMSGAVVRDAGWRASFRHGGGRLGGDWPHADVELEIDLSTDHWDFVVEQVERWLHVDESVRARELAAEIRKALALRP